MFYAHYSAQKINWPGNLLTIYAFFAVVGAFAVDAMVEWLSSRKNFAVVDDTGGRSARPFYSS